MRGNHVHDNAAAGITTEHLEDSDIRDNVLERNGSQGLYLSDSRGNRFTGNTIRMQILTRQEEIEVSKLIGASDAFIRRPFIHFAIAQGLLGGLLACGIVALTLWRLNPAVSELAAAYGQQFTLNTPGFTNIGLVCVATTLLCLLGAWIAVWQHLRKVL